MKIYIFGSTGMLGRYVYSILNKNYEVKCINRTDYDIENDTFEKLESILSQNIEENDVIINCSGIIPQKCSKDDYKKYIKVNTLFPHKLYNIIDAYNKYNKYNLNLIHITTDCVFDGTKGNYNENDIHTATDIYGVSKSLGEQSNATVIRASIIGEELTSKKSLIEWVKSKKDSEINGYTNHYWNGVTCLTLSNYIKYIIDNGLYWSGIKHIYSPNCVSKYDLCCYINKIYNLNINIKKVENKYINLKLLTVYNINFEIDSIYNQILQQYQYNNNFKYGKFKNLLNCRFCNNKNLYEIIKFNDYPLAGAFIKDIKNIIDEKIYPLTFLFCETCKTGLVKEVIQEDYLFKNINKEGYFYYSSTISSLVNHFKNLYEKIIKIYPNKKNIIEIGCNDGVFINNFVGKNYNIIGIDPSKTIENIVSNEIIKYNTFFNKDVADDILIKYGKQDIIVSCNCLAHIDNINDIYSNIKYILDDNGVLIIEVHYLKNIIENFNFDFIYHEHMSYYSINTIIQICTNNNFYIENIEFINTHGGSIRAFIKHKPYIINEYYNKNIENIEKYILEEQNYKLKINNLFNDLSLWKSNIIYEFENIKKNNILIGYGASGRTNMILNYLNIKFDIILDDSINKINSFIPYYHTQIKNSDYIYNNNENIKVIFILAWPYTNSIIKKHVEFIKNGGVFIKILPIIEKIYIKNYKEYL